MSLGASKSRQLTASGAAAAATALLLLGAGCAVSTPTRPAIAADESLVWPRPPDQPRIRYERSIGGPRDLGIGTGALARLKNAIFGSPEPRFRRPTGVAELDGMLYVADPDAHAVWIFDLERRHAVSVARAGSITLRTPVAVAATPGGGVYVADPQLQRVLFIDRDGRHGRVAAERGLVRPVAVAFDARRERLYVADADAGSVVAFDARGTRLFAIGAVGEQAGQFNHPTHLALDPDGQLFVTDALNFRVQMFDPEGRFLRAFGHHGDGSGDFASPKGVAADDAGRVYVVDALFGAVQLFDSLGALLFGFGEQGDRPGQFWLPSGIAINARGEVYVADSYNRRIQVFAAGAYALAEGR